MAVFLMAAAHGEEGNEGISRTDVGSKDYGTIYRRPDLENHIKPYIYDYLWTSLSHTQGREGSHSPYRSQMAAGRDRIEVVGRIRFSGLWIRLTNNGTERHKSEMRKEGKGGGR